MSSKRRRRVLKTAIIMALMSLFLVACGGPDKESVAVTVVRRPAGILSRSMLFGSSPFWA